MTASARPPRRRRRPAPRPRPRASRGRRTASRSRRPRHSRARSRHPRRAARRPSAGRAPPTRFLMDCLATCRTRPRAPGCPRRPSSQTRIGPRAGAQSHARARGRPVRMLPCISRGRQSCMRSVVRSVALSTTTTCSRRAPEPKARARSPSSRVSRGDAWATRQRCDSALVTLLARAWWAGPCQHQAHTPLQLLIRSVDRLSRVTHASSVVSCAKEPACYLPFRFHRRRPPPRRSLAATARAAAQRPSAAANTARTGPRRARSRTFAARS